MTDKYLNGILLPSDRCGKREIDNMDACALNAYLRGWHWIRNHGGTIKQDLYDYAYLRLENYKNDTIAF